MDISDERRKEIEKKLVETIIQALENDILTADEMPTISSYILDNMPKVKTQDELLQFLRDLSAKWAFFSNLLVIESGEVQLAAEQVTTQNVVDLAKSGKLDEALSLAKSVTEKSSTPPNSAPTGDPMPLPVEPVQAPTVIQSEPTTAAPAATSPIPQPAMPQEPLPTPVPTPPTPQPIILNQPAAAQQTTLSEVNPVQGGQQ